MPPFPPPSPRLLLLLLLLALSLSSCVLPSLAATADATAGDDAAPPGSTITDPNEAAAALIAAADAQAEAEAAPLAPPPPGVSHEFGALNTLLLVLVLGLCILSAYLVRVNRFYYLPESAAAILVGLVVGGLARLVAPYNRAELDFLSFSPEIFFFLLLPPIIFEAGYTLRKKAFFRNLGTILLLAVVGTLVSTFLVGFLTYGCGKVGLIRGIDTRTPLEALIFGALISAVDPVATLSIIGSPELNCHPLLYSLVFGESVLNDAVAIVLFRTFGQYYSTSNTTNATNATDNPAPAFYSSRDTLPAAVANFALVSLGSIVAGVAMALSCCYICKHTHLRRFPQYEVSLLFLCAWGSYAFAEALSLSGVMALFVSGVVLGHYNSYNLSKKSQIAAESLFKALGTVSEFLVFLFMGMGVFTGRFPRWDPLFTALAAVFCLAARAAHIFPLALVANLGRRRKIPFRMQVVMWFAGLRGAIAFALAQNMPGPNRDLYTTTALCICILTTCVCGGLTEPVLDRMGMKRTQQDDDSPRQQQRAGSRAGSVELMLRGGGRGKPHHRRRVSSASSAASAFDDAEEEEGHRLLPTMFSGGTAVPMTPAAWGVRGRGEAYGGVHRWWRWFDGRYMKPMFGGSAPPGAASGARRWGRGKGMRQAEGRGEFGLEEEEEGLQWSQSNCASEPEDGEVQELTERGPGGLLAGVSGSSSAKSHPQKQLSARPGSRGGRGAGGGGAPSPPVSLSLSGGSGLQCHHNNARTASSDGAGSTRGASPMHHRTSGRVSPLGVVGGGMKK